MDFSLQHYILGLYAVANNIPAIPLFLTLCGDLKKQEQRKLSFIAAFTSYVTMLVSMMTGSVILGFFGISIDSFRIAGGMLLIFSGLNMLNSKPQDSGTEAPTKFSQIISTAVIPIAIPLTSGAGTISTIILFSEEAHTVASFFRILIAATFVTVINFTTFRYSPVVLHILGHTGMEVLTKIFGLITLALGVQFIITGLSHTFPILLR